MEYAVVMAGGAGKRLWPLSRQTRPKQVLRILEGETLLRKCFERLATIFDNRNIIILTNAGYADLVRAEVPELPYNNVIAEPAVRDTSGAIGLAASILSRYDPDATMAVVTADQLIKPVEVFRQAIEDGLKFVKANPAAMITFGIRPSFASTQFGYVRLGSSLRCKDCGNLLYRVESFNEKPDEETAHKYAESEQYCWNSGMFVWKARTILANLFNFLPEAEEPLKSIQSAWDGPNQEEELKEWFVKMPKVSIDYGVMEKAQNVYAIKLNCQWFDLGSFAALADIITADANNNIVVAGFSEVLGCKNSIVVTEDQEHLIACIGMEDVVIAHSSDATLVCRIDQIDRLKELVALINEHTGGKFL